MRRLSPGVLIVVTLFVLGACAHTAPTNFYMLTSLPSSEVGNQIMAAADSLAVGLGPVTLPQYLDRPHIVTRASKAKLTLGEFDHWAAPLQDDVLRVMSENLSALIPTDRVLTHPWPRLASIDYQVVIDMIRFDGSLGGDAVLVARWRILDKDGSERLVKRSRYQTASGAPDYEAMVNALSRTLESLSREIASAINLSRARAPRS